MSFFKESILSSLYQQKKILIVVSIAFGFLSACYIASRYYFQAKLLNGPGKIFNNSLVKGRIAYSRKTFSGGVVVEGEFKSGASFEVLHGKGKRFDDNSISEGQFIDGLLEGQGTIIHLSARTEMTGNLKHGYLHGQGKRSCPDFVEEGNFEVFYKKSNLDRTTNELHGKGKISFPDGTVLEGYFKKGVIQGKRILTLEVVLEGDLKSGKLHGRGKASYPNGQVEEGEFIDGLLDGQGKITYPDGREKQGLFKGGNLVEP